MAIAFTSYGLLRYMKFPNDASKVVSVAAYGLTADHKDLEFVTPLLLAPSIMYLLRQLNSSVMTKGLHALSVGYFVMECLQTPDAVPTNLRTFLDKNCGASREVLAGFRRDCAKYGWITKEFTTSCSFPEAATKSLRITSMSIAKLQLLTMIMKMLMTRSLRFDAKRNAVEWARAVACTYATFMLVGGLGVDQYNKLVPHMRDSEDITRYRPSKIFQTTMFALCAYIAIHIQSKDKHRMVASCSFIQAVMTQMNKRGIPLKDFLPVICYLTSRF